MINYYISNNGDGSASLRICETERLAAFLSDLANEDGDGFAEDTNGYIDASLNEGFKYDETELETLIDLICDNSEKLPEYFKEFFNEKPLVKAKLLDCEKPKCKIIEFDKNNYRLARIYLWKPNSLDRALKYLDIEWINDNVGS